ncbi:MAG: Abi family protein [Neisseriaceae bacterium]|nr:Abi family protein [Neisseriaceae bacterium]
MLIDKNFTDFEQQIKILKQRNLSFISEEFAYVSLKRFGYYNIINGYKDPYIEKTKNGEEIYKSGVTFEQIFSLYQLDRNLRNAVINSMLEIEDNLRNAVAHIIAESFTAEEKKYLDRTNYRSGRNRNGETQLDSIMKKFNKILQDKTLEPVIHYKETYNNVPPWILLKGASFGNLVNFIKILKPAQKNKVISLIYNIKEEIISTDDFIKNLFSDTIFVCLDYRNRSAHGGRIYNYQTPAIFRKNPLLQMKKENISFHTKYGITGLPVLVEALQFFDNQNPKITLITHINFFIKKHLENYPQDEQYLIRYLNISKKHFRQPENHFS